MSDRFIEQARSALNPDGLQHDPLNGLRNSLVNKRKEHRGGQAQVEFLKAVADNNFLQYLGEQGVRLDFKKLESSPLNTVLPFRMQETEFVKSPVSTAQEIRKRYRDLTHQAASSVAVWNAITLCNIHASNIEASFLAASTNNETGYARIQKALKALRPGLLSGRKDPDKAKQAVDDCVRTVFRSMGGLPTIRGHTSVISDCTLSRHWWMGNFIELAAKEFALDRDKVWEALNPHWPVLAEWAVKRLTILANPALIAGFMAHLLDSPLGSNNDLRSLLGDTGMEFSTVDLHAWTAADVRDRLRVMRA